MTQPPAGITGATFALGYRFQRYWDVPMASAFFCGETGAGLFLVSAYFDFLPGMIVGMAITAIGKPYFHLSHMGRPGASWRAILRPDRSWISRGLIGIVVFVGFGTVHILDLAYGFVPAVLGAVGLASPALAGFLSLLALILAAVAGVVVTTYQGYAMSHSSAIALWSSGVMPVAGLAYALLAGTVLTLALGFGGPFGAHPDQAASLTTGALALLGVCGVVLASILHGANFSSKGGRQSVELLLKRNFAKPFIGLVIGVGLVAPAVLLIAAPMNFPASVAVAACVLVGYFSFRVLLFKAGVFEPILDITDGLLR